MIAGLPPEYGLYAAIVPAIIAALFGSSWHLISGPTAALSLVVYTTLSPLAEPGSTLYIQLALSLTLLAGLFQLILAAVRLGGVVNFVSHSVVIGFTSGAAMVIASGQLQNLLGLNIATDGSVIGTWMVVLAHLGEINLFSFITGLFTLLCCLSIKKLMPSWPNMLIALVLSSLLALLLDPNAQHIALVGSISSALPVFSLPSVSLNDMNALVSGALAIAVLGLVEAVSIARAVAVQSHQRLDGNKEFVGQGLSNVAGAFFSCYASSGSFTRTGINYTSGAKTPLAAVFSGVALLLILLLFSDLTAYIPIPSMAGILLLVSWNLINFDHIKSLLKTEKSEAIVLLVTFTSTLFIALEFAIYTGVALSLIFYLKKTSKPNIVNLLPSKHLTQKSSTDQEDNIRPEDTQLRVIKVEGSLFFGAVNHVQDYLQGIQEPRVLIVGQSINFLDVAGLNMLQQEARRRSEIGGELYFCNMKDSVVNFIKKHSLSDESVNFLIFKNKEQALNTINQNLSA